MFVVEWIWKRQESNVLWWWMLSLSSFSLLIDGNSHSIHHQSTANHFENYLKEDEDNNNNDQCKDEDKDDEEINRKDEKDDIISTSQTTSSSSSSQIILCTLVDGSVWSLDAFTGEIRSLFSTGRPLVGASVPSLVIPDLDGNLYRKQQSKQQQFSYSFQQQQQDYEFDSIHNDNDDPNQQQSTATATTTNNGNTGTTTTMQPFTTIQQILSNPVKTCLDQCGIVTGTKITSLYGLETINGQLVWTSHSSSSSHNNNNNNNNHARDDYNHKQPIVVLQREDYVVHQISQSTGQQLWNVTLGRFSALDFERSNNNNNNPQQQQNTKESLPAPQQQHDDDDDDTEQHDDDFMDDSDLETILAFDANDDDPTLVHVNDEDHNNNDFDMENQDEFSTQQQQQQESTHHQQQMIGPTSQQQQRAVMPPIAFDESGMTLLVLDNNQQDFDPDNHNQHRVLWKRTLNSVIARVYGIDNGAWIPLDVIQNPILWDNESSLHDDDDEDRQDERPTKRTPSKLETVLGPSLLLPAPKKPFVSNGGNDMINQLLMDQIYHNNKELIVYGQPPQQQLAIDQIAELLPVDIPLDDNCIKQGVCEPVPVVEPPQRLYPAQAPRTRPPALQQSPEGLFLTWNFVFFLLLTLMAGVVGLYFFYERKKRKWLAFYSNNNIPGTPQLVPSNPNSHSDSGKITTNVVEPLKLGDLLSPSDHQRMPTSLLETTQTPTTTSILNMKRSVSLPAIAGNNTAHANLPLPSLYANRSVSVAPSFRKDNLGTEGPSSSGSSSSSSMSTNATTTTATNHATATEPTQPESPKTLMKQASGNIGGIPLVRYARYASEFKETSALGKGGFGSVFECENVLDGRKYAMKKVAIQVYDDPQVTHERLQRVLREVKILAVLDHPNIVRYYTAWLELEEGNSNSNQSRRGQWSESDGIGQSSLITDSKHRQWSSSDAFTTTNNSYTDINERPSQSGRRRSSFIKNPLGYSAWGNDASFSSVRRRSSGSLGDDCGFIFEKSEIKGTPLGTIPDTTNDDASSNDHNTITTTTNNNNNTRTSNGFTSSNRNDFDFLTTATANTRGSRHFASMTSETPTTHAGVNTQQTGKKASPEKSATCKKSKIRHLLYIQMQLCSQKTLGDFLSNTKARRGSETKGIDIPYALSLFSQVAQGVKFIHEQALIHRDLKPSNCFLDDSGVVKVGDFGLSRGTYSKEDGDREFDVMGNLNTQGDNTAGVGTRSYASPEQMKGSDYDASTDIYSLGIILFELCYPMNTGMERHIVFTNLRNQVFPENWTSGVAKTFPSLHSMLLSMLSTKPCARPSADAVANRISELLSEFTVSSIDKSLAQYATLLRVEAETSDGVLTRTTQLIKDAAPHVKIKQYGLRGKDETTTIMEFALLLGNDSSSDLLLPDILAGIRSSQEIKTVRQVYVQ